MNQGLGQEMQGHPSNSRSEVNDPGMQTLDQTLACRLAEDVGGPAEVVLPTGAVQTGNT